jgi:heme oxygenase
MNQGGERKRKKTFDSRSYTFLFVLHIHQVKAQVGSANECPMFSFQGLLCSDGVPLIDAIEYRSWTTYQLASNKRAERGGDGEGESAKDDDANNATTTTTTAAATISPGGGTTTEGGAGGGGENDDGGGSSSGEGVRQRRPRGLSADYRPVTEPVSKLLKEGTKAAHKAAENVHFVREFVHGRVTRDVYRKMVANLYFVYQAMEDAVDANCDHPLLKPVYMPRELHRSAELEKDLAYYYGDNWRDLEKTADGESSSSSPSSSSSSSSPMVAPTAVARAYVARLRHLGETAPELLVPHAYTRYLGDLSGGQVLKRAAIKGMGLKREGEKEVRGVRFYDFEHIPNMREFKKAYRAKLDSLNQSNARSAALMDSALADLMVAEANYAFELNTAMFHELDVLSGFAPPDDAGSPQSLLPKIPDPDEVRRASLEKALQRQRELQEKQRMEQQMEQPGQEGAADAAKDPLAGCPFASLVRATGMPMPANHPGTAATGKGAVAPQDGLSKKTEAECASGAACEGKGCPMRNFGLVDYAIVLIFAAIFLLMMPPADQQASLVGRK